MPKTRKNYSDEFKFHVVLETYSPGATLEKVCRKHGIHTTQINQWRKIFKDNGHLVFTTISKPAKTKPQDDPKQLKEIIGDLTIENTILKKALSIWD
jgi:transposase